jgi:hypothetical protein
MLTPRTLAAAVAIAFPLLAVADRITDMPRTERCVYKARLSVAGYYHYLQGKSREAVRIHWHGNETQNEIDYVSRTLDEAYARAAALRHGSPDAPVSETQFGDQIYESCMNGGEL